MRRAPSTRPAGSRWGSPATSRRSARATSRRGARTCAPWGSCRSVFRPRTPSGQRRPRRGRRRRCGRGWTSRPIMPSVEGALADLGKWRYDGARPSMPSAGDGGHWYVTVTNDVRSSIFVIRASSTRFGAWPTMKRRLITVSLLSACALVLPASRATAQQSGTGRITGVITNVESNQPMQGVRVTLLDTQQTVTSNPQGHYTLTGITAGQHRIRASAIGYTPVIIDSIPVREGQSVTADIAMRHQTVELEKIVVTGYGSLAKRDVTGAIGQVQADAIKQIPTTNAIEAIKGRVSGVDIVTTGNKPGDGVRVRVRGQRSLKASNDPLYVLDGIPIAGGIGDLNPSDIESIEVLKDASATAIYGSRGANGVVLVTSKRGQAGSTRTSYDTYYGMQDITRRVNVFSPQGYADYKREAYRNPNSVAAGKLPIYTCGGVPSQQTCAEGDALTFYTEELNAMKNGTFTDWQDLVSRRGSQVSNQVSITGGNERNQYAVSGNLLK